MCESQAEQEAGKLACMALDPRPVHVRRPGSPLSDFVDCLWFYEGYVQPHARERVFPTGSMGLIFTVGADGRAGSWVAGARSESISLETSRPFSVIGVHFRPGGGFPFFSIPSNELHNHSVTLDTLWGERHGASIRDSLWEADSAERRFDILERALLDNVRGQLDGHPAVRYALGLIHQSKGARPVSDIVQRIGISSRRFVELFRSEVGFSPKLFCRIRRFNETLRRIELMTDVNWGDVALSCGYFDQAHFNHDFHAFSGMNPSTYLRDRTSRTHVAAIE